MAPDRQTPTLRRFGRNRDRDQERSTATDQSQGGTATDQSQRISPWAIVGIIVALIVGPLGLLVNAFALHRISQTGQRGQSLAAIGLAISIIVTIFSLIFLGSISYVTQVEY